MYKLSFYLLIMGSLCTQAKYHDQLLAMRQQATLLEKSIAQDYERLKQTFSKKLRQVDELLQQDNEQTNQVAMQIMHNLLAYHKKLTQDLRNHAALKSERIVVIDEDNTPSMAYRAKQLATNAMEATKQSVTAVASSIKHGTQRAVAWTKKHIQSK